MPGLFWFLMWVLGLNLGPRTSKEVTLLAELRPLLSAAVREAVLLEVRL